MSPSIIIVFWVYSNSKSFFPRRLSVWSVEGVFYFENVSLILLLLVFYNGFNSYLTRWLLQPHILSQFYSALFYRNMTSQVIKNKQTKNKKQKQKTKQIQKQKNKNKKKKNARLFSVSTQEVGY